MGGDYTRKKLAMCFLGAALCFSTLTVSPLSVSAAQKGWNLRYVKGAPTSECVTTWNYSAKLTQSVTSMSVTSISGGATVFLYTSNGISTLADRAVLTSVGAKIGTTVYAQASYRQYGSGTNYPTGILYY